MCKYAHSKEQSNAYANRDDCMRRELCLIMLQLTSYINLRDACAVLKSTNLVSSIQYNSGRVITTRSHSWDSSGRISVWLYYWCFDVEAEHNVGVLHGRNEEMVVFLNAGPSLRRRWSVLRLLAVQELMVKFAVLDWVCSLQHWLALWYVNLIRVL